MNYRSKYCMICLLMLSVSLYAQETGNMLGLWAGDTIYATTLELKTPVFKPAYLLVDNSEQYELGKVKFYQNSKGYFQFFKVDEFSEGYWLKREATGKINTWSREKSYYNANTYTTTSVKVNYFTKGDSKIKKINYLNLKHPLSGNSKSMEKLKEANTLSIVNATVYVVGAGLLIGGIVHTMKLADSDGISGPQFSPLIIVGAAILTVPIFTGASKRKKLREAITIYNE